MPTIHVAPDSQEALQEIANGLLKARKVVFITGAGISTNSGIPDFRSRYGMYSIIQAQFDAATRRPNDETHSSGDELIDFDHDRTRKRRKISCESTIEVGNDESETKDVILDTIVVRKESSPDAGESSNQGPSISCKPEMPTLTPRRTRSVTRTLAAQTIASPSSSPPPEELPINPTDIPRSTHASVLPSSPLSSPPPGLFEPSVIDSGLDDESSRHSSTAPSEVDDSSPSPTNLFNLSQTSNSGRNTLPNMKGKDLFDSSIWSDPARTSVFYSFTTALRQKVKHVVPTPSHHFISHLRDLGKLVRCYTQNIDQIEEKVGLSTSLQHGPGIRGRFSRKSTTSQLSKMVDEVSINNSDSNASDDRPNQNPQESSQQSQTSQVDGTVTPKTEAESSASDAPKELTKPATKPRSGVECVFLHGSLEHLRCFLCGRVCSWDDQDRELETLAGQQPECPHCVGTTTAREERGKRALGVGKLRPDIVLYGEDHPNAHLISPIITHDLALCPDLLLILGTSLRVHGLKVMVKEFARAVHSKGGKVVFINFTKPPESSWGEFIDYWIEWDCDAWVKDLQDRIPKLWQAPEPPKPKKKKAESHNATENNEKPEPHSSLGNNEKPGLYRTTDNSEKPEPRRATENDEMPKPHSTAENSKMPGPLSNLDNIEKPEPQINADKNEEPVPQRSTESNEEPQLGNTTENDMPESQGRTGNNEKSEPQSSADSNEMAEMKEPSNDPASHQDTEAVAALLVPAIMRSLHAISTSPQSRRHSTSATMPNPTMKTAANPEKVKRLRPKRAKRSRDSAPGALERTRNPTQLSTLNPNHGRSRVNDDMSKAAPKRKTHPVATTSSSIVSSVKDNPRKRKASTMPDGQEWVIPKRERKPKKLEPESESNRLKPLMLQSPRPSHALYGRPDPLEPRNPPSGPPLGPDATSPFNNVLFRLEDPLQEYLTHPPCSIRQPPTDWEAREDDKDRINNLMKGMMASAEQEAASTLVSLHRPSTRLMTVEETEAFNALSKGNSYPL